LSLSTILEEGEILSSMIKKFKISFFENRENENLPFIKGKARKKRTDGSNRKDG